jgi:hypothetical protein
MNKTDWISVKDKLPEDNIVWGSAIGIFNHYKNYLITDGKFIIIGHYRTPIEVDNFKPFWDGEDYWFESRNITHWMPLPHLPDHD